MPHRAVTFEAGEENRIVYESLYCVDFLMGQTEISNADMSINLLKGSDLPDIICQLMSIISL